MAFLPPLFSNLGKATKDLFDKKFESKNVFQVKNKLKTGLLITSGADVGAKGVGGLLKLKYKKDSFGEAEADLHTGGHVKGSIKAKKLAPGTIVTVSEDSKPKERPSEPCAKVNVDYQQDIASAQASFETSFWKFSQLVGSVMFGTDGLSVGGQIKMNAHRMSGKDLDDFNVGAQYEQPDYTASIVTTDKISKLKAQAHIKANDAQNVGFVFTKVLEGSDDDSFALATEYKVDAATNWKAKADTKGVLTALLQHRLANPKVLVGATSSFDCNNLKNISQKDFGLSFTFGDYDDE